MDKSNFLYKKFKHDLKNPMNAMIGYSEYIIEEIESDEYIIFINDINLINNSCKNINDKISESLDNYSLTNSSSEINIDEFQYNIRTSLCTVVGLIELVKEKLIDEKRSKEDEFFECINNIYLSCKSMLGIIDNIQVYYKEKKIINQKENISNKIKNYESNKSKIHTKQHSGNVLIIDDDVINSKLIKKILLKLNHSVEAINDGRKTIETIEKNNFDIILLDIIMPGINGIEVLQMIKQNPKFYDIPIIMLSALDDLDSIVDCINLGANDFITKPIDKVLLSARINNCLERKIYRDNEKKYLNRIKNEEKKSNELLLNIMPPNIAERLKDGEKNIADRFEDVTVLFADISGFTKYSSDVSPKIIVKELNDIFSKFDDLVDKYNVEKIKTIGDNYMIASGIPYENKLHAETVLDIAMEMQKVLPKIDSTLSLKIGISSGEVVAGVIGKRKFIYDLWGDTVNVASRMERYGENNKIHISSNTYDLVKNQYQFSNKNEIMVKGKGNMETYYLINKK